MYCYKCGKQIDENSRYSSWCGANVAESSQKSLEEEFAYDPRDKGGIGWMVLGFFIPLVGLILFLAWTRSWPNNSKAAGLGALLGVVVWFFIPVVLFPVF